MLADKQPGFTLLEILFVLLLVGLAGSLVVPRVGVIYDNLILRGDRERLVSAIQGLPQLAFSRRVPIHPALSINTSSELINIPSDWGVTFSEELFYQANGFCSGGNVTLSHASERQWQYQLTPPFCIPRLVEDGGQDS